MARKEVMVLIRNGNFEVFGRRRHYARPPYRTPKEMAVAGYGWQDIAQKMSVSEERARFAVFGPELKVKVS